eukprot:c19218_g1_i2.p1 GENE.c19218_g1_i2~~c19218_g1_i2.p1  ORF type:complete len:773 (+),score=256.67 c19218_g1_i2:38-2356(+)
MSDNQSINTPLLLETARVHWDRGLTALAISLLKDLLRNCDAKERCTIKGVLAPWLGETKDVDRNTVVEEFFKANINEIAFNDVENKSKAHYQFALYSDSLFEQCLGYEKAPEFREQKRLLDQMQKNLQKTLETADTEEKKNRIKIAFDATFTTKQNDFEEMRKEKEEWLEYAMNHFVYTLQLSDYADLHAAFRLISLWFSTRLEGSDDSICSVANRIMISASECVPSHKFIDLFYQLVSRSTILPENSNLADIEFQNTLKKILIKMSEMHPHHCIPHLLALMRGAGIATSERRSGVMPGMNLRIESAKSIVQKICTKDYIKNIMLETDYLTESYVNLAFFDLREYKNNKGDENEFSHDIVQIKLRRVLSNQLQPKQLHQITNLKNTAVFTSNLKIRVDGNYDGNFPHVVKFSNTFSTAGGINLPRIVNCYGSDGKIYKQLVKGEDDMRQDAVMEQVFVVLNKLLQKNPETRSRNLNVRTYKVIPLSPKSGVVEWVTNTIPLSEYLIGGSKAGGAHVRYRPNDMSFKDARQIMTDASNKDMTSGKDCLKARLPKFREVCSKVAPVFHYFFLEKYDHPTQWYQKRLAYTRSIASNSMVGFILGLGDRHSSNILIDQTSAEVIHIDLGVAFDKGKTLKTPERVPFRLTRDIVDGMGVSGVEGVFRRCCEISLQLMRDNRLLIYAIVEVLSHDPLSSWSTQITVQQTAPDDGDKFSLEGVNLKAEDVLLQLKRKLIGIEEYSGHVLSVDAQVKQLIIEAQDEQALCRMFPGWAPWL